jgi:hypothetical protein
MSQRTPVYNFYYLQANDIIFPGYDYENQITAENEIKGVFDYFGQGIISGWRVHWMGCTSDPYVMQQRSALINGYNSAPFSYYGLEYESIGKPGNKTTTVDIEAAWSKCIVVEPGQGIIDVYHVATEYPSFFSISSTQDTDFYIWAEKNACTPTEYLCDIIVPQYPDPDYDLSNQVVYIGEVYFSGSLQQITQIYYDPARRKDISSSSSEYNKILKQALLNHVHSGENDMPSKIDLSSKVTINLNYDSANPDSNVFSIVYPSGFILTNYAPPKVYLNGVSLPIENFTISGSLLYLKNSIQSSDTLQIVYEIAPGTAVYIISSTQPPEFPDPTTLSYSTFYMTDGTYVQTDSGEDNTNGARIYNVFTNWPDYSRIDVYLQNGLVDPSAYIFNKDIFGNYNGTITFIGPILPSIDFYELLDIQIKFITPQIQISGILPIEKISSIDAAAFNQGKVQNFRLTGLDHLGLFRNNDPAYFVPTKKLLDSGNHILFYPVIDSPIQHADYIVYSEIIPLIKSNASESEVPYRTVISTPNGLFLTYNSVVNFDNIVKLNWNTDAGIPDSFNETYFGNNSFIAIPGGGRPPITNVSQLDPKYIWVLCKSINQFKNIIYLSQDSGVTYNKLALPFSESGNIVTINDFISTVDAYVYTTPTSGALGEIISNYNFSANYLYYIAATDGLYTASLARGSNPLKPFWANPTKNTTNYPTGSLNKISEAMNVGYQKTTVSTNGVKQTNYSYTNYRALYASCDNGFFVYQSGTGIKFTTQATNYNTDNSAFTFVKWLGSLSFTGSFSQAQPSKTINQTAGGVVWSDSSGVYFSNSAKFTDVTVASSDNITSTETLTWYEPLTNTYANVFNVSAATISSLTYSQNTKSFSNISAIDNYTLASGDYVLVKNQDNLTLNGIYQFDGISNLILVDPAPYPARIFVQNGSTQSNTEWADINNAEILENNATSRAFTLLYANIIPSLNENINCACGYFGNIPTSVDQTIAYQNSFLVSSPSYIIRVLVPVDSTILPITQYIAWSSSLYGKITSIKHYPSSNAEGTLVVFTENGIYRNSDAAESDPWIHSRNAGYVKTNFDITQYSYIRYISSFNASGASNASVYDDYTLEEFKGQITSVGLSTNLRFDIPDGTYASNNLRTQYSSPYPNRSIAKIDFIVKAGIVTASISSPGSGYEFNLPSAKYSQLPYCVIGTSGQNFTIFLSNIQTKGYFYANSDQQSFIYSLNTPINPSRLLYETDYTTFYTRPWKNTLSSSTQVVPSLFGKPIDQQAYPYSYISDQGKIVFQNSIGIVNKDHLTVSLINIGQYISNTGTTPHVEVSNLSLVSSESFGTLSVVYPDPNNPSSNILNITYSQNYSISSLPQNQSFTVQITDASGALYRENIICYASTTLGTVSIILRPQPSSTNSSFLAGSKLYLIKAFSDFGIQDKISLSQSKLPYYLSSVSHANVYNLYNTIATLNSNVFNYPVYAQESLTGTDRGLKNTISIREVANFDPSASFSGFAFGVDPSSFDVAAAPSNINLILDFQPGVLAKFATDKGLWTYNFVNQTWSRSDTLNNSQLVYFADGAHNNQANSAGTNKGLFTLSNNQYVLDSLFAEPILSYLSGDWNGSGTYYAYGKSNGFNFTLQTTKNKVKSITSDFSSGGFNFVYNLHYAVFKRFDENNNVTWHPAIYLATDRSIWAYTTDPAPNAPTLVTPHTLLYGREMLGFELKNPSKIDPTLTGTIPVQVYQLIEVPSGGKQNWLVAATSNGVYVFVNWLSCDVGNPSGLNFYPQNQYAANQTIGHHCYVIVPSAEDSENTFYVGTEIGVFKSSNKCGVWTPCANFNNKTYSVSDLKSFTYNSDNYLVAATSNGLWISNTGGDSWYSIQTYPDAQFAIPTTPVFGIALNQNPVQTFSSPVSGYVNKAFLYLNSTNLSTSSTLYATISNGTATTVSSSSMNFNSSTFPSMYAFSFSSVQVSANTTYYLGVSTGLTTFANISNITWGLSNLTNPYSSGSAKTSGGVLVGQDFFFKINLSTPPQPIEIIEPVGFYNTSYTIGFASGVYQGASINTFGQLVSNVGIVCNLIVDLSKSIEINDTGIITKQGISTGYVKYAVLESVSGAQGLASRVTNAFGTSKIIASLYGFNNSIIDLISNSSNTEGASYSCLGNNQGSTVISGYTNNFSILGQALNFVNNTGRLSRLYDATLFASQLQFPQAVIDFYKDPNNISQLDANYLNVSIVAQVYQKSPSNYIALSLALSSPGAYNIYYQNASSVFKFSNNSYKYGLVTYTDSSTQLLNYLQINQIGPKGIFVDSVYPGKTAAYLYLSRDWVFTSLGLSTFVSDCLSSEVGKQNLLKNYSYSFKPLILVTTDGNDNSNNTPEDVNSAIETAWDGFGTQVLVIEPNSSGNENYLRNMISGTNSKLFKYSSYPASDLKNALVTNDALNLFTSSWSRNFDYSDLQYINYVYASYVTPGSSQAVAQFKWTRDRINFSDWITLPNGSRYVLKQKVASIYYRINMTEAYDGTTRYLPSVTQLYHSYIIPAQQTLITYPSSIQGQMFETLAMASLGNIQGADIVSLVGRTQSTDTTYFETVQLNRNSALPNRQTSFKIRAAYSLTALTLYPFSKDSNGNYNYLGFYVVDANQNIITWDANTDQVTVYTITNGTKTAITSSPGSWQIYNSSAGQIKFTIPLYDSVANQPNYNLYFVDISFAEKRSSIIGEPTSTYDYKTYYFLNGRIPTDSKVVVLVNQVIFRGSYNIDYYDGAIIFDVSRDSTDYVSVFIKFAEYFRTGLQISTYDASLTAFQSFNLTYTALPDLTTYAESFVSDYPTVVGTPYFSPTKININDIISLNYNYYDQLNIPEQNSEIYWWRQRTGVEYAVFNSSVSLPLTGVFTGNVGLNIQAAYGDTPFVLNVFFNCSGSSATISSAQIIDRGLSYVGVSTLITGIATISLSTSINNINNAIYAVAQTPVYSSDYITLDGYVRINPSSGYGYANTNFAYSSPPVLAPLPNYDGLLQGLTSNLGTRGLFDYRDNIYATITPFNGYALGPTAQTNVYTLSNKFTPTIDNLFIVGSNSITTSVPTGFVTTLTISSAIDQTGQYNYNPNDGTSSIAKSTNNSRDYINWYKTNDTIQIPQLISSLGVLSSSLIFVNDNIQFSVAPKLIFDDGSVGCGNTAYSDYYRVV